MPLRLSGNPYSGRKLLLAAIGAASLAWFLVFAIVNALPLRAQSATADWEKAAGGKMSFEVASVKRNVSGAPPEGPKPYGNFNMGWGDAYNFTAGLLQAANIPLVNYIKFAYKILPGKQAELLQSQLPKWANEDRYDIEARAAGNPSKDQMRLMMQSLLADRFKLSAHIETRQVPVYDLLLVKGGKLGPQLQPHSAAHPCFTPSDTLTPNWNTRLAPFCGTLIGDRDEVRRLDRMQGQGFTMKILADSLSVPGQTIDRPVLDKTGLSGAFDFSIEYIPEGSVNPNEQYDENGPHFLEALEEQLGLKLVRSTGPIDVLVIDHIEQPTPN